MFCVCWGCSQLHVLYQKYHVSCNHFFLSILNLWIIARDRPSELGDTYIHDKLEMAMLGSVRSCYVLMIQKHALLSISYSLVVELEPSNLTPSLDEGIIMLAYCICHFVTWALKNNEKLLKWLESKDSPLIKVLCKLKLRYLNADPEHVLCVILTYLLSPFI